MAPQAIRSACPFAASITALGLVVAAVAADTDTSRITTAIDAVITQAFG